MRVKREGGETPSHHGQCCKLDIDLISRCSHLRQSSGQTFKPDKKSLPGSVAGREGEPGPGKPEDLPLMADGYATAPFGSELFLTWMGLFVWYGKKI